MKKILLLSVISFVISASTIYDQVKESATNTQSDNSDDLSYISTSKETSGISVDQLASLLVNNSENLKDEITKPGVLTKVSNFFTSVIDKGKKLLGFGDNQSTSQNGSLSQVLNLITKNPDLTSQVSAIYEQLKNNPAVMNTLQNLLKNN
jgi:hypothetical protein